MAKASKVPEHDADNCIINEVPNVKPEDDCGHTINEGPGVGVEKYDGQGGVVKAGFTPDSAKGKDQDPKNGPGV